jgi:hypothetical protein
MQLSKVGAMVLSWLCICTAKFRKLDPESVASRDPDIEH